MLCTLQQEGVLAPSVPWSSAEVFSLAAGSQVNDQKPHQGVTGKNPGLHRAFFAVNSTTALGVSWGLWSGTVPGARVSYEYDAFGNKIASTGTTPNNYLYRGEQWDSGLGLYYLRARYYDPMTDRFVSRDPNQPLPPRSNGIPTNPTEFLKYTYAGDDPVNKADPGGRAALEEGGIEGEMDLTTEPAVENLGRVEGQDICYELYLEETAQCGEYVTDDKAYEKCMDRAWFNLFRCREGLPPI